MTKTSKQNPQAVQLDLHALGRALAQLDLMTLGDVLDGSIVQVKVVDEAKTVDLEWLQAELREVAAEELGGEEAAWLRERSGLRADLAVGDLELDGLELDGDLGMIWLACVDGIAARGADGGIVVRTWEELL